MARCVDARHRPPVKVHVGSAATLLRSRALQKFELIIATIAVGVLAVLTIALARTDDLSWLARVQANAAALNGRALTADGMAWRIPDFLSPREVNHVLRLAQGLSTLEDADERYQSAELPVAHWAGDKVLAAVEARIAQLTGIEVHADESPLMLAVSRPWRRRYEAADNRLQNLHHDQNTAPQRVATVLVYLTGGLQGGETLFPCLSSTEVNGNNAPIHEAQAEELCRRLTSGFEAGHRILWPAGYSDCWDPWAFRSASALCDLAAETAESAATHASRPLRVPPHSGEALLFFSSWDPNSSRPAMQTWHGGCRVLAGEKWTLQKFKETHF